MTEFLVLVFAFVAGALLYFALRKDLEESLFVNIEKNLFFPILIILTLVVGIYVVQFVHLSESAGHSSNVQQRVFVFGCVFESPSDCQSKVDVLNNESYAKLQAGAIDVGDFFIPFSLQSSIVNNAFTYFCAGILLIWLVIFGTSLQVKK